MDRKLKIGIMGAILGGLDFKLRADTEARLMEAERIKQERLMQLQQQYQIANEQRDNAEWERRFGMEGERSQQEFEMEQEARRQDAQFGHQLDMSEIEARQAGDMTEIERRAELDRQNAEHQEQLLRERPQRPGQVDGIYGDDGKFYPAGTPIPAGVRQVSGFGVSWGPSASKTNPSGSATSVLDRIGMDDAAPVPGARKAADGKWYVQGPSGWMRVDP